MIPYRCPNVPPWSLFLSALCLALLLMLQGGPYKSQGRPPHTATIMHVVYSPQQAYPAYVITYAKV